MASNTLKNEAYEARMVLEEANMKLAGIVAAHDLLHISAESDTPMSADLMFPFMQILYSAIDDVRERIEAASCVLQALASEETPSQGDQGADAYGKVTPHINSNQPGDAPGFPRFTRAPEHDRRISRGDDFSGDAWLDQKTGSIVWGAVGVDRNANRPSLIREIIGMAIAALIFAASMWTSVFGMSGQFAPTSEAVFMAAGGADGG